MSRKSIGLIETMGLCAGVTAADAAVKSANVTLVGYEYSKGDGMCTVKVEGDVGAVKAAVAAGSKAAEAVCGIKSLDVIARPAEGILPTLIYNKENVGGEYHLKTGIRPKGQSAGPVLVKKSKPEVKAEAEPAKEEAPVVETPEETPVEEIIEEAPVEVKTEEPVVVETAEEETKPEAPVKEDTVEAEPVEESKPEPAAEVKEEVTEKKEEVSEPAEEKKEAPADAKAEVKNETADDSLVVKSTSRGKRGGRKPRGNSPKKDNE